MGGQDLFAHTTKGGKKGDEVSEPIAAAAACAACAAAAACLLLLLLLMLLVLVLLFQLQQSVWAYTFTNLYRFSLPLYRFSLATQSQVCAGH
jgi:hypothetical protein